MRKPKPNIPSFFAVRREPLLITAKVDCDVCGMRVVCIFIPELDRWMCESCTKTVAHLLKVSEPTFD